MEEPDPGSDASAREQCQDQQPKPDKKPPKLKPDAKAGERLFVSLGCLACHTWQDLGASGWFGGGDLTHIGDKRPAAFFTDWLSEPARLNRDHRMPVFPLSADERASLSLFLAAQKSGKAGPEPDGRASAERRAEGKKLHYPESEAAGRYGASTPEESDTPDVAYSDMSQEYVPVRATWPL